MAMKHLCLWVLAMTAILIATLAGIAAVPQEGRTIPTCRGEECRDDVTGRLHLSSPAWCQNKDRNGFKANCSCKRSCDRNDRGSDCVKYCNTPRCKCDHGCPMTE